MFHHTALLSVQKASAAHPGFNDPEDLVLAVESLLPSSDPSTVDDVVVAHLVDVLGIEAVVVDEGDALSLVSCFNL